MVLQYQHPKITSNWLYIAYMVIIAAAVLVLIFGVYRNNYTDRFTQGCLEWCQSHGAYDTPEQYLDCAWRCEQAVERNR